MKKTQALDKLRRMVEKDLPNLAESAILRDGNNYDVFSRYQICPKNGVFSVEKYRNAIGEFVSLQSALSWCIADKYQQTSLGEQIRRLDQEKLLLIADLAARTYMSHKIQDKSKKEAVQHKIDTRKRRLGQVDNQLDKCINLAKYWQIRGFNNETARTGRQPSNRTNR